MATSKPMLGRLRYSSPDLDSIPESRASWYSIGRDDGSEGLAEELPALCFEEGGKGSVWVLAGVGVGFSIFPGLFHGCSYGMIRCGDLKTFLWKS